jgi:hypothetical protein
MIMPNNYFRVGVARTYIDVFPFDESSAYDAWAKAKACRDKHHRPERRAFIVAYRPPCGSGPWDGCGIVGEVTL